ncbi:MAG: hypothetical protein P8129_09175 [Anaerolineae bacterium]
MAGAPFTGHQTCSQEMPSTAHRSWLPRAGARSLLLLLVLALLAGCGSQPTAGPTATATPDDAYRPTPTPADGVSQPPVLDLAVTEDDVSLEPLPLRAGYPFTVTATIHNESAVAAPDVLLTLYISAEQPQIGFESYLDVLTITVPASDTLPVSIPVDWNLAGGEHRLWLQVNRVPDAWQDRMAALPEDEIANNQVLLDLMVEDFDAYASDLCAGRVDVEIDPADVLPDPDRQQVRVRVHNLGNHAVYNLPVVVLGGDLTGVAYTPAIPPCGGTAEIDVPLDGPLAEGQSLTVMVNPEDWEGGLAESSLDNNQVTVSVGLAAAQAVDAGGLHDYDFAIDGAEISIPQAWTVLVQVHNYGTRDADMVPIRIENEAGRALTDSIPLVRGGGGIGVAAMRIGYLWIRGGTLTFTINPSEAKNAYPETRRDNNVATFTLP